MPMVVRKPTTLGQLHIQHVNVVQGGIIDFQLEVPSTSTELVKKLTLQFLVRPRDDEQIILETEIRYNFIQFSDRVLQMNGASTKL